MMLKHRRSIRLQGYDYTQSGAYFVTICSHRQTCLFGKVVDDVMQLNDLGKIVQQQWEQTAALRPNVELDAFGVMPNHVHGIIVIDDGDGFNIGDGRRGAMNIGDDGGDGFNVRDERKGMMHHAPTDAPKRDFSKPIANSLSTIVGSYKAAVTRHINRLPNAPHHPIWQRNYYEHIIRNEASLNQIRGYILYTPAKWAEDSLYVE